MHVPQEAIDAARTYERLTAGWDRQSDSFAVYLMPRAIADEAEVVEAGFPSIRAASDAVHRIRAEKIIAASRGLLEAA